jgi:hypothetical protein
MRAGSFGWRLVGVAAAASLSGAGHFASAQEALPTIEVGAPAKPAAAQVAAPPPAPAATASAPQPANPFEDPANPFERELLPKEGANIYALDRAAIEALPQGDQTPLEKVLLQTPGVSQDSAASGNLHIRNEHANVQYRVDGILLPDGVSGFSQLMETSFASSMSLVTGALPAQYGLRTSALVNIVSRAAHDAGRQRHALWRQSWNGPDRVRLWREDRPMGGLRGGPTGHEQSGDRKPDKQL